MLFADILEETKFSLYSNKSRSALTILGIVIGIASVITMVSIGQGSSQSIQSNIESLGSNLLVVSPGFSRNINSVARSGGNSATTLTMDDATAITSQISGIKTVASVVNSRQQVKTSEGTNTNTSIYGITTEYIAVKSIEIASGSALTKGHNDNLSKVAIIGPTVRDDLFGENTDPLGKKIRINGQEFSIIGLTESKGGTGFGNADDLIYIPLSTAQRYLSNSKSLSNINVEVEEKDQMTIVQQAITDLLLTKHRITDATKADFSIINQADILSTASEVTGTMTLLLAAIAGISLLVGGIGIMNMMLTTVTERTKEIGLRKSLGAKNKDISNQFLCEAIALTFLGGFIGIILGCLAAGIVTKFSGTATYITLQSIMLAFGVSALIGIIFGYYPAKRAAKLNPIEALRFE